MERREKWEVVILNMVVKEGLLERNMRKTAMPRSKEKEP